MGASRAVSFSEVLARMAPGSLDGRASSGFVRTATAELPPPLIPIASADGALPSYHVLPCLAQSCMLSFCPGSSAEALAFQSNCCPNPMHALHVRVTGLLQPWGE
jgi:hypothetical protein